MVPTISTLLKIANALEKPVAYFVEEDHDQTPAIKTGPDQRPAIFTSHEGIDLGGISGPYGDFLMAGAVATVIPAASSGDKPMLHEDRKSVVEGKSGDRGGGR